MKLPNRENARVSEQKITAYLLSMTHPTGRDKAAFFWKFGFAPENWQLLRDALLQHADIHEVAASEDTLFGMW